MSKISELAAQAAGILQFVGPLIKVAQPGSPMANTLADTLDIAGKYLRFADKLEREHLTELAEDFASIKSHVEELAAKGEHVPQDEWNAVGVKITSAADRIRAATGK